MTNLKQLIVVTSFAALVCTGVGAQTVDLWATIPFNFHAGDKLMPAGEYYIHERGAVLWVRGANAGEPASALLTYGGASVRTSSNEGRLDFDCYGSEHFLTALWSPASDAPREVLKTARQKELAARYNNPVKATITLASTK